MHNRGDFRWMIILYPAQLTRRLLVAFFMTLIVFPSIAATPTDAVIATFQFSGGDIVGLSAGPNGETAVYDRTPGSSNSLLRFLQAEVIKNKLQVSEATETLVLVGDAPGFKGWMLRDGGLLYALARMSRSTALGASSWAQMWLYIIANRSVLEAINYNGTAKVQGDEPAAAPLDYRYAVNGFALQPPGSEDGNNVRLIIDDTLKGNLDILDLDPTGLYLTEQERHSYRDRLENGCQWPDIDPGPFYTCHWNSIQGNGLALDWAFETRISLPGEPSLATRDEVYILDPIYSQAHLRRISIAPPGENLFWAQEETEIDLTHYNGIFIYGVDSLHMAARRDRLWIASGLQSFDDGFVPVIDTLHLAGHVFNPIYGDQNLLIEDPTNPDHRFIPVADSFASSPSLILREVKNGSTVKSITVLTDYTDEKLTAASFDPRYGLVYLAIEDTVYVVFAPAPDGNDSDGDGIPNHLDPDDDNDGMPDDYEKARKFDPLNPADAYLDSDHDSFTNFDEFLASTDPWLNTSVPAGDCGDATVVITEHVYPDDETSVCPGSTYLIAGPGVTVSAGANVTYSAPRIKLRSGFSAEIGSVVHLGDNLAP